MRTARMNETAIVRKRVRRILQSFGRGSNERSAAVRVSRWKRFERETLDF